MNKTQTEKKNESTSLNHNLFTFIEMNDHFYSICANISLFFLLWTKSNRSKYIYSCRLARWLATDKNDYQRRECFSIFLLLQCFTCLLLCSSNIISIHFFLSIALYLAMCRIISFTVCVFRDPFQFHYVS